ncbi:MAG: MaoC family dehydratase [Flammeovirgaceae bacterium]|nr:MaoC family dehydratase [Flammeovirgaceae bacterium]
MKFTVNNFAEFEQHVGKELGVSEYLKINQEQINKFAEATLDHQWIHTDPQRAATESQFKSTIAHGYLTLSVVPYLWEQIADIRNVKMLVNYGIEKLKFNQPVLVNQEVRLRVKLQALTNLRGIAKAEMDVALEIKDNPKPAFTSVIVFLYHFKRNERVQKLEIRGLNI